MTIEEALLSDLLYLKAKQDVINYLVAADNSAFEEKDFDRAIGNVRSAKNRIVEFEIAVSKIDSTVTSQNMQRYGPLFGVLNKVVYSMLENIALSEQEGKLA